MFGSDWSYGSLRDNITVLYKFMKATVFVGRPSTKMERS